MNSKTIFWALATWSLMCAVVLTAEAQQTTVRVGDNDVSITLKTQKTIPNSAGTQKLLDNLYTQMYVGKDRIIPRVIADVESGLYFGYDLEVSYDSTSRKVNLSVKPLSIKPNLITEKPLKDLSLGSLPNYPSALVVEDGDTVFLDILEDPRNGVKIIDSITVRISQRDTNARESKAEDSGVIAQRGRDLAPETLKVMKLNDVKIFVNDVQVANPGGLSGSVMYFFIPGKGRFIFSLSPHDGYSFQRIGTVEANELSFAINGDRYKLVSSLPIVAAPGRWNLWVLHDSNFRPDPRFAAYSPYWMGVADRVEDFLERTIK